MDIGDGRIVSEDTFKLGYKGNNTYRIYFNDGLKFCPTCEKEKLLKEFMRGQFNCIKCYTAFVKKKRREFRRGKIRCVVCKGLPVRSVLVKVVT